MLIEMLQAHPTFNDLPLDRKEIFLRLAAQFQDEPKAFSANPEELPELLQLGTWQQWDDFLSLEPVINYINEQMKRRTRIAQRKALDSLTTEAQSGSVQASKEINDLSGIMDKKDNSKVIILHQVSRPAIQQNPKEANT